MSKINIDFNGTSYSVDESALSAATTSLQSHLSSVMNGSGAKIRLGGVDYNVDSTKLSNATNSFISHIGTISGNGAKVVVNGVEYSIDSTKISTSVNDLHNTLSNMNSSQGDEPENPDEPIIPDEPEVEEEEDWYTATDGLIFELNDDGKSYKVTGFDYSYFETSFYVPSKHEGLPVTRIGEQAFYMNDSITQITLPNSLLHIDGQAFSGCYGLSSITIGNKLQTIGWDAFFGCANLTRINLPASVTTIGFCAFGGCGSLTNVYYSGTEEQWNSITIEELNDGIYQATIHYNA